MSEYTGAIPITSWGFPMSAEELEEDTRTAQADQEKPEENPSAGGDGNGPVGIAGSDGNAAEGSADSQPTESQPKESLPEETLPEETLPGETGSEENAGTRETLGTVAVTPRASRQPEHVWCFVIMGVLAALCLGLLIALITGAFRPRKRKKGQAPQASVQPIAAPQPAGGVVQAGKLHFRGDRESQQDCMALSPLEMYPAQGVLAVVADGMGGLSDGDQVSQAAVTAMMEGFLNARETDPLALTIRANQAVNTLLGPTRLGSSGTTLVAGIAQGGMFRYVSVGDSRICLFRRGSLIQLNREHIYRNELATRAVNGMGTLWDANSHPKAGGLTSYLGMGELKYVDIPAEPLRLEREDKIILMSDGVYNALTKAELESALVQPAQSAADTIARMIQAKAYRNQDNYTALILEF